MHELQKVYVACQGSRDSAGFNWNTQLIAQVEGLACSVIHSGDKCMFCMTNLSYATYNEWFYHPNYLLRGTYITMQAIFGQALCLRKSKLYFLSFLVNSYCALLPKYMF